MLFSVWGAARTSLTPVLRTLARNSTTRKELHKEEALWRVALAFGFVFDVEDVVRAIQP